MQTGIYKIFNKVDGKFYLGSAKDFKKRWTSHVNLLRNGKHHSPHLQHAWSLYGEDSFSFLKILVCDPKNLLVYEQICLDGLAPEYNVCRVAGNSLGRKLSDETKAKISAKALGRKWTEESKKKLSKTMSGRKKPDGWGSHLIGNTHAKGSKHTEEWKKANSLRMTGRASPKTEEHRAKISAALKGRKASDESRANQAAAQRGKQRRPYNLKKRATGANDGTQSLFPSD